MLWSLTRAILGGVIAVLSYVSLTSFAVNGAQAQTHASNAIPIVIAWQPNGFGAFYVAKRMKLFEKVGLAPTYVKFLAGPPMLSALESDSVDVADMGITPFVIGAAKNVPIVAIMVAYNDGKANALIARPNSGISSVKDLKGKRVVATRGSLSYVALLQALERNGMTVSDINYLDMAVPTIIPAFQHGDVDAAWAWEPWAQKLIKAGGKEIATWDNLVGDVVAARKKWIAKSPEGAIRFIAAMDMAAKLLAKDPQLAAPDLVENLSIPPDMASEILTKVAFPTVEEQLDPESPNSVRYFNNGKKGLAAAIIDVSSFFKTIGMIDRAPELSPLFDFKPIKTYADRNGIEVPKMEESAKGSN